MPGTNSIVGIQSGLDWVGIVDAMITFERQNAVLLENQQADKTDIITTLKAAQAKALVRKVKEWAETRAEPAQSAPAPPPGPAPILKEPEPEGPPEEPKGDGLTATDMFEA